MRIGGRDGGSGEWIERWKEGGREKEEGVPMDVMVA